MGEVCTDNRFEIIEKAKQQLLEWTNIRRCLFRLFKRKRT